MRSRCAPAEGEKASTAAVGFRYKRERAVLVCDDDAWAFAPTALYVQAEVQSDETPNPVTLFPTDVNRICDCTLVGVADGSDAKSISDDDRLTTEIGREEVSLQAIERAKKALDQAPPVAFDVARQVRVFEPYIQYVEISLFADACHDARTNGLHAHRVQGVCRRPSRQPLRADFQGNGRLVMLIRRAPAG